MYVSTFWLPTCKLVTSKVSLTPTLNYTKSASNYGLLDLMIKSDLPTTKTTSRLRQMIKFNIETSFKPDHISFTTDGCLDSNSCVRRVGTSAERLPPSAFFRLMATNLISPGSHNNNIININNNNNSSNNSDNNSNRAS